MPVLTLWQIEPHAPGASLRTARLKGWAAPTDEMTVGGSQRAQLEWIFASSRASVRLDGPEEDEITLTFDWKTRLVVSAGDATTSSIGPDGRVESTETIERVEALVEAFHAFRREPALVMMDWDGTEFTGFVSRFSATQRRAGEYTAELSFQPVMAPNAPLYLGVERVDPIAVAEDLSALFEDGVGAGRAEQMPTFRARETNLVDEAVEAVREGLSQVQVQAGSIRNSQRKIAAVQEGVAFAIGGAMTAGSELLEALLATGEQIAQSDEYAAQIKARLYRSTIRATATRMRVQAGRARRQMITAGDSIGTHVSVGGETLWSISWRWYGTTRHADIIASRNGLTSPFVNAGVPLIIPRRPGHG